MRDRWITNSQHMRVAAIVFALLFSLSAAAFGRGQAEPPEIQARSGVAQQSPYFSPSADSDGVYQIAIEPSEVEDEVVEYFLVAVINETNEIVWMTEGRNEQQRGGFGRLLQNIGILQPESSISFDQLPRSVAWDGTYSVPEGFEIPEEYEEQAPGVFAGVADAATTAAGTTVSDGPYQYVVSILYSNDALSISSPDEESTIYVDDTPPEGELSLTSPETGATGVFAPGAETEGAKQTIDVEISVTAVDGYATEETWTLEIRNADGESVTTVSWEQGEEPDDNYSWDGTDGEGAVVPNGAYQLTLSAVDQALNETAGASTVAVTVDSTERSFDLSAAATNWIIPAKAAISPNGDGIQDELSLSFAGDEAMLQALSTNLNTDQPGGAVVLSLTNADGEEVTIWTDLPQVWTEQAAPFSFDGNAADGERLDDGVYLATVTAHYQNGMTTTDSIQLVIDSVAPSIDDVTIDPDLFSPDGDGFVDTVTITHEDIDPVDPTEYTADGTYDPTDNVPADYWFGVVMTNDSLYAGLSFIPGVDPTATPPSEATFNAEKVAQLANQHISTYFAGSGIRVSADQLVWLGSEPPETFPWAGEDPLDFTETIDDGTYEYYLLAVDTAGNVVGVDSRGRLTGAGGRAIVQVDTGDTAFELAASAEIGPRRLYAAEDDAQGYYVSPNGDGISETITFSPELTQADGIATYTYEVLDADGEAVFSESGSGTPDALVWDGSADDGDASDGLYTARLSLVYEKGDHVAAETDMFMLDRTEPTASVTGSLSSFSPNGDGIDDSTLITPSLSVDADQLHSYTFRILDQRDNLVRGVVQEDPSPFTWNGRTTSGAVASNGTYTAVVEAEHLNGTVVPRATFAIELDAMTLDVSVESERDRISPNGDGDGDQTTITPGVTPADQLADYTLQIQNADGRVVRTFAGNRPQAVTWDGTDNDGAVLPDGDYTVSVAAEATNGNTGNDQITVTIFTPEPEPPAVAYGEVGLMFTDDLFSPNGDGVMDTAGLRIEPNQLGDVESWALEITNSDGSVKSTSGTAADIPEGVINAYWDGRNDEDAVVEGSYVANLELTYVDGTTDTFSTPNAVRIDVTPPSAALRLSPQVFSPDGDGRDDTVQMTLALDDASEIADWTLSIHDADDETVATFAQSGGVARSVTWDGVRDDGELIRMAEDYTVAFTATDAAGNTAAGDETLTTDIFVEERFDQWKIQIPDIIFQGWTAVFESWDEEYGPRNVVTLDRLAMMLEKFPEHRIELHGHAVSLLFEDPVEAADEQEYTLLPLSEDRAQAIEQALVDRGISEDRIEIKFFGGARPIIPFSNLEERRINRRVEFYLIFE